MKPLLVALALFVWVLECSGEMVPPKIFSVDLDSPPETRWNHVIAEYKWMAPSIAATVKTLIPPIAKPLVDKVCEEMDKKMPQPFPKELRGIAEAYGLNLGDIVLLNIIYDLTAFCTSIVAEDPNGVIWHARNLDFYFPQILRNLTIVVNFQRSGKTVYTATSFAGYVGLVTGQKPNGYSITVDTRGHKVHVGELWQNILVALLDKNSSYISFLIRQVLEKETTYDAAVTKLSNTIIHAPAYFIVAGASQGQGTIITRDRLTTVNRLDIDIPNKRWYVVETNYDNWKPPPKFDDRRTPAEKAMNATGRAHINEKSLVKVLNVHPVLNENTTYSIIMVPSQPSVYQTWIQLP